MVYIIIVWNYRHVCGPSLTETLCGARLYSLQGKQMSTLTLASNSLLPQLTFGKKNTKNSLLCVN